ncbi:MAG: MBL fold metallo-hydrolase [Candidatus Hadarchaeota archaeon]
MTKVTFYGGIGEIGGSKILLEDGGTRVWLEFGQSFGSGEDYFTGWIQPRGVAGAKDYFEFGLVPKIRGLYSREALRFTDLKYHKPDFDAIFISHPHYDHIARLDLVDSSIPVHISRVAKAAVDAIETTSQIKFGEHDYRAFEPGKKIKVGSIEVIPMGVDHSAPGACGFIIHTSSGAVVYTGDFRKHGPSAELTERFISAAAKEAPVAMICEGTRMSTEERQRYVGGESDVGAKSREFLSDAKRLAVATFYPRDIDRMATFVKVAKDIGRKLVLPTRTAFLLSSLAKEGLDVPKIGRDYLVYARRKESGGYLEKDYDKWERPFIDGALKADDIHKRQKDFLLNLDFYHFAEFVDINPDRGSHFVYSMSEPYPEEEFEAQVMLNWLRHFKLRFHQVHSSGHCSRREIEGIVREVNPKHLFPIHSEQPELFHGLVKGVHEKIEVGKAYEF